MPTVRLSWRNRVQADSLKVYRSTAHFAKDSPPTALDTISASATEYDDTTAAAGSTYFYALGVVKSGSPDEIALSDVVEITTDPAGAHDMQDMTGASILDMADGTIQDMGA